MNSEYDNTPTCIGFIMDGNRRWAKEKSVPTLEGHRKGAETFVDVVGWVRKQNIQHAVFYAFSTENWKRSEDEVGYLTKLGIAHFKKLMKKLGDTDNSNDPEVGVRFRFIGDKRFGEDFQKQIEKVEAETKHFTGTTVWIAASYGGRSEILAAVNQAIQKREEVDEQAFRSLMWSDEMPDPDFIVRTGGEQRLSNFLTWQSAYSELVFLKKFWPDLTTGDLDELLREYQDRSRRFGT